MTAFRLFLFLATAGFSFAIVNTANAANTTPRGYIKNIANDLGNNSEFTQKSASKKARNFIEKNRKNVRKDRRNRKKQKPSANTGVNE
jgi:hypothetical protein